MITMAQTIICFQGFAIVMHIVASVSLVFAGGLFCAAYILYNNELNALGQGNNKICILDLKEDFTYAGNTTCTFSFAGEFVAVVFLLLLAILGSFKIACGSTCRLIESKICLLVELLILLLPGIFASIVAGLLTNGWRKTCHTVHDITKAAGISSECNYGYMKLIPASAGFAVFAVMAILLSFITIISAIIVACLKSRESDNEKKLLINV